MTFRQSCNYQIAICFLLCYQIVASCSPRNSGYNTPRSSSSDESSQSNSKCTFNLDRDSPKYAAHLINLETKDIIQPVLEGSIRIIHLSAGQIVTIACEGKANQLNATDRQITEASCITTGPEDALKTTDPNHPVLLTYHQLGCRNQVKETVKEGTSCYRHQAVNARNIEIGWQVNDGLFINQLTVCHDSSSANTLYSVHRIVGASVEADDEANKRPSFRKGNLYPGFDVEKAYSQVGQKATMTRIFGADLVNKYIDAGKSYFFARGHLAPDGDFIDAGSQDATYYYINVAPQWQSFNNGNWRAVESAVRNLAASRVRTFTTYTGVFGVLKLADSNGQQQPIYLATDLNNNNVIPVPKYYWKVIHDPTSRSAVAFVGINNPHLTTVSREDVFCDDVCSQMPWVNPMVWNRTKIPLGFTFCCSVHQLHNVIDYAPNLGNLPLIL